MSGQEWVPLFSKDDTTSTSTPLSESRRGSTQGSAQGNLKTSPTPVYINRTYSMSTADSNHYSDPVPHDYAGVIKTPKLSPTISREWAGSTLMQRGPSTGIDGNNGISSSSSTSAQYPSSSNHARKRSITAQTTPLLHPSSSGMERIPSLTSFMTPREAKNRNPVISSKSHRRMFGPVFLFRVGVIFIMVMLLIQIGKWGFLGSTAENYIIRKPISLIETFDLQGSPILVPLHIPSWYDRLVAQSLTASFPKHETFAYSTKTHPTTPNVDDTISLADYLTTRLGSHFSTPSSGIPTHLWITTATKTSILISTRHLQAFVASLDHKATKANEKAVQEAEEKSAIDSTGFVLDNLAARAALVVMCMDNGCMEICRQKKWYCFGGFKEDVEEVKGGNFDSIREIVKLHGIIGTLESGRRVFVVDRFVLCLY